MDKDAARKLEHEKYHRAYEADRYRMGGARKADAEQDLAELTVRGSYLDVGAGRGEMLDWAEKLGFEKVVGTEVVPQLLANDARLVPAEGHKLPFPDNSFEVVSMFDVIEHLLPGDEELVCRELLRVASHHVLLTANNRPSKNHKGEDLHINIREYTEWDALFREWFAGCAVDWKKGRNYVSEGWRIDL